MTGIVYHFFIGMSTTKDDLQKKSPFQYGRFVNRPYEFVRTTRLHFSNLANTTFQPVILSGVEVSAQGAERSEPKPGSYARSACDEGISFGITIACHGKCCISIQFDVRQKPHPPPTVVPLPRKGKATANHAFNNGCLALQNFNNRQR